MQALYRVVPDVIVLPFLVGVCSARLDSYGTKLILVLLHHSTFIYCIALNMVSMRKESAMGICMQKPNETCSHEDHL